MRLPIVWEIERILFMLRIQEIICHRSASGEYEHYKVKAFQIAPPPELAIFS
jgi:hypothetical protein